MPEAAAGMALTYSGPHARAPGGSFRSLSKPDHPRAFRSGSAKNLGHHLIEYEVGVVLLEHQFTRCAPDEHVTPTRRRRWRFVQAGSGASSALSGGYG